MYAMCYCNVCASEYMHVCYCNVTGIGKMQVLDYILAITRSTTDDKVCLSVGGWVGRHV